MKHQEVLDHFRSRQAAMIDAMHEIVEIESPSRDVAASGQAVAWIEQLFRETGAAIEIERIPAADLGEHILIRAFPSAGRHVFMLGHSDTVHHIGSKQKNPTRIEDGRFYGCGIFDMKANIVLMAEALRYFAATDTAPLLPVTILISCDEEIGSPTGRSLVEREAANAEFCLVCEPSAAGRVKTGRKGTGMYRIAARGIPAHAGLEPEKGASAILELCRQIEKVHGLGDPDAGTTANVCTIAGGTTTNVIPEHAECSVDVRFTSISEADRISREMAALVPEDKRVKLEVTGGTNRPPMERTEAVASLYEKARGLAASFDYELGETQVGGASDGNFAAAMGIPVLDGLGIAGDGAHTLQEYIEIDDIANRATLVTLLLANA